MNNKEGNPVCLKCYKPPVYTCGYCTKTFTGRRVVMKGQETDEVFCSDECCMEFNNMRCIVCKKMTSKSYSGKKGLSICGKKCQAINQENTSKDDTSIYCCGIKKDGMPS